MDEATCLNNNDNQDDLSNVSMTTGPISPLSNISNDSNKQRIKFKKDALELVDFRKEYQNDHKYKTELCRSWTESGFCVYGNKCRFAHGRPELFDKVVNCKNYKQKECISFYKYTYCCYGSRCHFRHEERNIRQLPRSYYTLILNNLNTMNTEKLDDSPVEDLCNLISLNKGRVNCRKRLLVLKNIPTPDISAFKTNMRQPKIFPNQIIYSNKFFRSLENYNTSNNYFNSLSLFSA